MQEDVRRLHTANTSPFCTGDLSTQQFWYLWGAWSQSPSTLLSLVPEPYLASFLPLDLASPDLQFSSLSLFCKVPTDRTLPATQILFVNYKWCWVERTGTMHKVLGTWIISWIHSIVHPFFWETQCQVQAPARQEQWESRFSPHQSPDYGPWYRKPKTQPGLAL